MIKVNRIYPIDSKSTYKKISDLEDDFLSKFRKNKRPENLLSNFITTGNSRGFIHANAIQIEILNYLHNNFSKIIKGKPKKLKSFIDHFATNNWGEEIFHNDVTTAFGNELMYIFGYTERFRSNVDRGIWLANQLNIKTCPYCNAQNTILTNKQFGKQIAKFQFDHFFPKSEYPYLSLSLYNLIPSCANCNSTKSSKHLNLDKHYHPYVMNLADLAKFKLKYIPDPSILTLNNLYKQNLEIEFTNIHKDPLGLVNTHNELYHINGVYNRHNDVAEDLLKFAIVYTKELSKSHLKIKGLFKSKQEYYHFLLRNYPNQKDSLKRPLAKMTQDVAKQLKLIK
ncbi:hypothetical protein GCM10011531_00770 [Aquaticitalea lipolytica]|uniref:HNH domain-containing protein n=1 Tax=Aquaticitalea lipolytica TaxID=1247562 RepID=A0A8J2XEV3_9FLAO|nr:HNH endonuclease [Aquaticitalea lipolytica]GFZ76009.1 hypothetical protein GCM10011531_00770 [Aquaticitalea lipolytica]